MENNRETIFEFIQVGNAIKVVAIDVTTGTEVTIMGPKTASQYYLQQQALSKLLYVMKNL